MNAHVNTSLPEVECACIRCERRFGLHVLEPQDDGSIVPIEPVGRPAFAFAGKSYRWEPMYGWTRQRRGPRTGTGLYNETFGGRSYLRVICKCGRNEKLGRRKLDETLFDEDGHLRLRDGVLYV